MNGKKNSLLLQDTKQLNTGAILCGIGFLLYLAAAMLAPVALADVIAIAFGLAAVYVFISALALRRRDKESVSYSLMWGMAALSVLLLGCAALSLGLF